MESIEELAKLDPTESMNPGKRKRIKKAKRTLIGYDSSEPQMCANCLYFENCLVSKKTKEYFPPRCKKHNLEVERHATCNHWKDNRK